MQFQWIYHSKFDVGVSLVTSLHQISDQRSTTATLNALSNRVRTRYRSKLFSNKIITLILYWSHPIILRGTLYVMNWISFYMNGLWFINLFMTWDVGMMIEYIDLLILCERRMNDRWIVGINTWRHRYCGISFTTLIY